MRVCIVCGQEFSDSENECPYCGYPKDGELSKTPILSDHLPEQYSFMRAGSQCCGDPLWIFLDNEQQRPVVVGEIPAGAAGRRKEERLRNFQRFENLQILPEILEICAGTEAEGGYYIYQDLSGEYLGTLVEKENPLNKNMADHIAAELERLCGMLEEAGLQHGDLGLHNLCLKDGALHITDFGSDTGARNDRKCAKEIVFRLREGYWQEDEKERNRTEARLRRSKDFEKMIMAAAAMLIIAIVVVLWLFL